MSVLNTSENMSGIGEEISYLGSLDYIFALIYAIQCLVGMLGNIVAIWILTKLLVVSKTPTNICMLNLSIADCIFCTFVVPFMAQALCFPSASPWTTLGAVGLPLCKVFVTYQAVMVFVSIYTMVVMTADRYFAVVHPIASITYRNPRNITKLIVAVWVVAITLLSFLVYAAKVFHENGICGIDWNSIDNLLSITPTTSIRVFAIYVLVVFYLAPLLTIVLLYYKILHTLYQRQAMKFGQCELSPPPNNKTPKNLNNNHNVSFLQSSIGAEMTHRDNKNPDLIETLSEKGDRKQIDGVCPGQLGRSKDESKSALKTDENDKVSRQEVLAKKKNKRTTKLVMTVVLLFAVCLFPYQVQLQIWAFDSKLYLLTWSPFFSHLFLRFVYILFFLNNIVNPFVYTFQCQPFQEQLRKSLPVWMHLRKNPMGDDLGRTELNRTTQTATNPHSNV